MKPQTIEIMTNLSIEEIKSETKELLSGTSLNTINGDILCELANNCRNIANVAEALENIFLTAACELERIKKIQVKTLLCLRI